MKLRDNSENRYGSAEFASFAALKQAELTTPGPDKILNGFTQGSGLHFGGQGGKISVAGARSGKLTSSISYTALGACWGHHAVYLDVKSEIAAISQLAVTLSGRHGIYWSPVKLPGAPTQHRIAVTDYVTVDSLSMVEDIQMLANNMVAKSHARNGNFFDGQAKQIFECLAIALTRRDGVLSLPALYEAVTLLPSPTERWLERVGFYMHECKDTAFHHVYEMEEFISRAQNDPTNETFQNFIGVLTNSLTCLSSPSLRESLSPYPDGRYDFSFSDLIKGENLYSVFICIPQEYLQIWGPVIRAVFVAARIWKSRNPASRPVLAVLDECGNTGGPFPLAVELFTIGAGINLKPWAIFQSQKQIANLAANAEDILLSSAQTQQYFGIRDYPTAESLAKRIGTQTLHYEDEQAVLKAAHARKQALYQMIAGGDVIEAALRADHHAKLKQEPHVQARYLRTPDEILNTPVDQQYIFTDGVGAPILCEKRPYFDQTFMAGRYLPNPYHSQTDRVQIKTRFGREWRCVITEPVPDHYVHLPQYKGGFWTRLDK